MNSIDALDLEVATVFALLVALARYSEAVGRFFKPFFRIALVISAILLALGAFVDLLGFTAWPQLQSLRIATRESVALLLPMVAFVNVTFAFRRAGRS